MIQPSVSPEQKKESHKQLRVAAYCRVSTDSDEQELSFEAQREYYTDKIMRNPEWTMAGIFADEGISGTQANKRKEFMRMIRLCRQGKIDLILTKSVSRFSRNTVDCLTYVRELKGLGIPVVFEKEGLNTMHMTSEIYISMHGIFAQSESESLSGNVRMGVQMAAKKGKVNFNYSSFLGYRRGPDNKPEIDPEQAETVKLIYQRFLAGDSLVAISRLLNEKRIPTPMKKTNWGTQTIQSILTNEKYKGDALLQKTYVSDCITHKIKKNDDRPKYYVENNHPAIISPETFNRVQEEIARRNSKRKVKQVGTKTSLGKYSGKYALTERLVCGKCGSPYRRCTWTSHGVKRVVWRCISRLDYGTKYCPDSPTIYETDLHAAIMRGICDLATHGTAAQPVDALKLHVKAYFGKGNSTAEDELRAQELISRITQAAAGGVYSEEMASMVAELNELKQRIAEAKARHSKNALSNQRMDGVMAAINKLSDADVEFSDDIVRQIVDCVRIQSADKIEISFKNGDIHEMLLAT